MFTRLYRIVKNGVISFWRNRWISQATIGVMVLTLFVIVSLLALNSLSGHLLENLKAKMDISVYFKIDTPETDILNAKANLEKLEQVQQIEYTSRANALDKFKKRHQHDPLILQSLEEIGANPLTASLNIRAKDPSQFAFIDQFLNRNYASIVDKVNYQENKDVIERISKFSAGAKKGGIFLSIGLIAIVMLVTFNTIRLAIYSMKDEISIMRLVGASNAYIRGPLIIEGIICGVIATIITTLITAGIFRLIAPRLSSLFLEFNLYQYLTDNFWEIIAIEILIGVGLGVIGSYIAIRKYLKI